MTKTRRLFLVAFFAFFSLILRAETEPNNVFSQANAIALNGNSSGSLGGGDTEDWWKVTVTTEGSLTFNVITDGTLQVNNIQIYDQNGSTLLAGGSWNTNASVTVNNVLAGTYYLRIPHYGSSGTYSVSNVFTVANYTNDIENNDLVANSTSIGINDSLTGRLGYASSGYTDNTDWYKFTIPADGRIDFQVVTTSPLQVNYLKIFDVNGVTEIASGSWNTNCGVTSHNLLPGTYFIRIPLYGGYGSYYIKSHYTPAYYEIESESNDSAEVAIQLNPTDSITAHLGYYSNGYTDNKDWYKFTIPADGKIDVHLVTTNTLTATPLQVDYLKIYDADTVTEIASGSWNTDCGVSKHNLLPGTYFIRVSRYGGFGSYYLTTKYVEAFYNKESENNDSSKVAVQVQPTDSITAHLGYYSKGYTDNTDWYKFTIPADGKMDIRVVTTNTLTTTPLQVNNLKIYDTDTVTEIASGSWNIDCGVSRHDLLPGTYFIKVPRYGGFGSYYLTTKYVPAYYAIENENNDSSEVAIQLNPNDSITAHMGYYRDGYTDNVDWYKFTIPADGRIDVHVVTTNTLTVTPLQINYLKIYDTDTTTEISSGSWNVDCWVSHNNLLPGTYFLKVPRYGGFGSYYLVTKYTPAYYTIDSENNDLAKNAIQINPNDSITGHLGYYGSKYTDDTDWFKVTIPADGRIDIHVVTTNTLTAIPLQVNYLKMYDQDTVTEIASGSWNIDCWLTHPNLLPGVYFIKVPKYGGYGSYYLISKYTPSIYTVDNYNDSIEVASEIFENDSLTGHLGYYGNHYTDNVDWWRITPTYSGKMDVNVKTDGLLQVNYLGIYSSDETLITSGSWNTDAWVSTQVKEGKTYFIKVPKYGGYGGYSIKDTILPAPIANFKIYQNLYFCSFTDSSLYATSYKWDFGDGTTSTTVNPSHTYATPGVFDVTLITANAVSSDTIVKHVSVKGIQSIVTNKAGNSGYCTIKINGGGLTNNTTVKFSKSGSVDILPDTVYKSSIGAMTAVFNLSGVAVGTYDVVVNVPGDTVMTVVNGFTVEQSVAADVWFNMSGRDRILFNRWQTYTFNYGNNGNNDAYAAPVWIVVSDVQGMQMEFASMKINTPNDSTRNWKVIKDSIPVYFTIDSLNGAPFKGRVYPLIIPVVPANYTGSFTVRIKTPSDFQIYTWVNPDYTTSNKGRGEFENCIMWAQAKALADGIVNIIASQVPGADCLASVTKTLYSLGYDDNSLGSGLYKITEAGVSCAFDLGSELPFFKAYELAWGVYKLAATIYEGWGENEECKKKFKRDKPENKKVRAVSSFDPNEMIGPHGYKSENYYTLNADYNYQILFENKATATAPAQEVFVYDTLDLKKVDLSTFSLGDVNFGDTTIHLPLGLKEYSVDVDMRPGKNIILRINAALDTVKGIVKWEYRSLDPATMDLTEDPDAGFLPPNVVSPEGEGFVSYSIRPKSTLLHGDTIANRATIIFDLNAPILTNTWSNIIDLQAPASNVNSLDATVSDTSFMVTWSGNDNQSGVQSYQIYYKKDNGPVLLWKSETHQTQALFSGVYGSSYSFYSVAIDSIGNTEIANGTFDATTTLVNSIDDSRKQTLVNLNLIPNPASSEVTVDFNLTRNEDVNIEIYDAFGKVIIQEYLGELNPGKHQHRISLENLSNGVYSCCLQSSKGKIIKKMVVSK